MRVRLRIAVSDVPREAAPQSSSRFDAQSGSGTQSFTAHYANGAVDVRSAGSEPGDSLNPVVVDVLHERGLSTEGETATLLTFDGVQEADVVITMGCGETCPVFPGKTYEDWQPDDPKGQDLATVRRIVAEIDERVQDLLSRVPL